MSDHPVLTRDHLRRRVRWLLIAAVLGAAAAVLGLGGTADAAPTCTIYWKGATSNSWTTTTNWSLTNGGASAGRIPTATDVVCMSTSPTRSAVTYPSGIRTVASIQFPVAGAVVPSLTIQSGTLNVGSASGAFDSVINNLSVPSGAILGGTANESLTGTPVLSGTLSGAATATLAAGTTTNTTGFTASAGRIVRNDGALTHSGCVNYIILTTGAVLDNAGTYTAATTCGYYIYSDDTANPRLINRAGATLAVTMPLATDSYFLDLDVENAGTITATTGTLTFQSIHLAATGVLTSSGPGTTSIGGTVNSDAGATIGRATLQGGTLTGNPTVTALTSLYGTFTGGGTLTIPTGSTADLQGLSLDGGSTLLNQGTLLHGGCSNYITLSNGSVLDNAGTYTATTTCGYYIYGDGTPGTQLINRAGATLTVALPTATDTYQLSLAVENAGSITATGGHLSFQSLHLAATGTLSSSGTGAVDITTTVDSDPGSTIGVVTLTGTLTGDPTVTGLTASSGTFTGGGTLTIPAGATAAVNGLAVDGASTVLNQGTLLHSGCVNYITLSNGSVLDNAGTYAATTTCGYYIYGDGTPGTQLINRAGATLTVALPAATDTYQLSLDVANQGVIEVTKGVLVLPQLTNLSGTTLTGGTYKATSGTIQFTGPITTNAAALTLGATGNLAVISGGSAVTGLTTNSGSLILGKSLTTNKITTNSGTVAVNSGTYQVSTYTQSTGTTTVLAGATLRAGSAGTAAVTITGGTLTGSGTVAGALSGAGTVNPAGTLTVSSTYAPSATGTLAITVTDASTAGRLSVTGAATLNGTLAITTADGLTPPVGTSYTVLSAASRTGTFSAVTGQNPPNGTYYDVTYNATSVVLTVRALPQISVSDATVAEGNSGTSSLGFTVTLAAASTQSVQVDYATSNGTATSADYTAASGTLSFAPGTTSQSVNVSVLGDTSFEPDETLTLTLTNPVRGLISDGSGTGTITNDDTAASLPTVTAVSPAALGQGVLNRQITLTGNNFLSGSQVAVSGTGVTVGTVTFVDATTLRATVSVSAAAATGVRDVTLTNAGVGSGTCTGCLSVTAKPVATSTAPALGQGATQRTVVITGTGFQPGAKVKFTGKTGVTGSTSYVSSTQLEVLVTVTKTAGIGTYAVQVTNRDGGVSSCAGCFTVLAGPTVTSMTPASVVRGTTTAVTITGTGYIAGAQVVGPAGVTFDGITVVNATTITADMTVLATRATGTGLIITVVNPASGGYGVGTCPCLAVTA